MPGEKTVNIMHGILKILVFSSGQPVQTLIRNLRNIVLLLMNKTENQLSSVAALTLKETIQFPLNRLNLLKK